MAGAKDGRGNSFTPTVGWVSGGSAELDSFWIYGNCRHQAMRRGIRLPLPFGSSSTILDLPHHHRLLLPAQVWIPTPMVTFLMAHLLLILYRAHLDLRMNSTQCSMG